MNVRRILQALNRVLFSSKERYVRTFLGANNTSSIQYMGLKDSKKRCRKVPSAS